MTVNSNFTKGQLLTAGELNATFGQAASSADLASTDDPMKGAALVGFKQNGAGAVARTVQSELLDYVSVRRFGAVGNGITDDSAAISAADTYCASAGLTLWFPDGIYAANNLSMTAAWNMSPGAMIRYNGAQMGQCLQCNVSNLVCGDIRIDGNLQEPKTGFYIGGNYNRFRSVTVNNLVSTNQTWVVCAIYNVGNYNIVGDTYLNNYENLGNTNKSSPQGLVHSAAATGNRFGNVFSDTTQSPIVDNSTGNNQYGNVYCTNCQNNGAYLVGGGNYGIGAIFYDGTGSAAAFRHGSTASIGQVHIFSSGDNCFFFGDCADVTIGQTFLHNVSQPIGYLNLANTGKLKFGSIKGTLHNTNVWAFQTGNGPVEYLAIDEMDVQLTLDGNFSVSDLHSLVRLDAANGVNIGRMKIDVILNGYTPTTPIEIQFNPTMTYQSFVGVIRFAVWQSDFITPYTAQSVFVTGYAGQANTQLGEGVLNTSNYIRASNYTVYGPNRVIVSAAPTTGTWTRGTVLWIDVTTASQRGWVCTASGTPGTWATF